MFALDLIEKIRSFSEQGVHALNEGLTGRIAQQNMADGDTVLDVGANAGDHTGPFAINVGQAGTVHAFEPNPDYWSHLAAVGPNVRLWPYAAGDALGVSQLHVPLGLPGWASLKDIRADLHEREFKLRTCLQVAIDDLPEVNLTSCTFIKIDVEGYELNALQGMARLISRGRPIVIFENATSDILQYFAKLDYSVFDLFGRAMDLLRIVVPNNVAIPRERPIENVVRPDEYFMNIYASAESL